MVSSRNSIFYRAAGVAYPVLLVCTSIFLLSCNGDGSTSLAPYEAYRPLTITAVTHGYKPDIDWLGGRVAAVGINTGQAAGLDSTLVWLRTATDDNINAFARMGVETDLNGIIAASGSPVDSLEHGVTYTFWIATKEAYDSGLDTAYLDEHNFAKKIQKQSMELNGRTGGQVGLLDNINIIRDQNLTGEKIHIYWEPADEGFNQVVLRYGTSGGYTNRLYHVVTKDTSNTILPPLTLGEEGDNLKIIEPWEQFSLQKGKLYFVWMSKTNWIEENFSTKAYGYAYYLMYKIPN